MQRAVDDCTYPPDQQTPKNILACSAQIEIYGHMNQWEFADTLTDMSGLFLGKKDFNQDISDWDVVSVTDIDQSFIPIVLLFPHTFCSNKSFVTNMNGMFKGAASFNGDIQRKNGKWNTQRVENMEVSYKDEGSQILYR